MSTVVDTTRTLVTAVRQARAVPMAIRAGIAVAGAVAGVLAGPRVPLIAVAAVLPALWPATILPGAYLLVLIGTWIADTTVHDGHFNVVRLVALAVAMYYVHAGAAFAAVLPYDAVVGRGVMVRWLVRMASITVITVAAGIVVEGLIGALTHGAALGATIGGLVLVIATTIFLGRIGLVGRGKRGEWRS